MRIRNIEPLHSVNSQFSGETQKHEAEKDRDNKEANIRRIQSNVYISTIDSGRYGTQRPLYTLIIRESKEKCLILKKKTKNWKAPEYVKYYSMPTTSALSFSLVTIAYSV